MSNPYAPDKPRSERIIEEIKELAEELNKIPTMNEFDNHGEFTTNHAKSEFGSWATAKSASNVTKQYPSSQGASPDELIEELQRLYDKLGRVPKVSDLKNHGIYKSSHPYRREFGTWKVALQKAGYEPNSTKIDRQNLIKDLQRIAIMKNETPQVRDIKNHSKYSIGPYNREFGSLNNALEESDIQLILDLIKQVQEVSESVGGVPTVSEVVSSGQHEKEDYFTYFKSWQDVISSAKINTGVNTDPYRGELLKELQQVQDQLNRSPQGSDIREFSEFHIVSYIRVFGSFETAIESI